MEIKPVSFSAVVPGRLNLSSERPLFVAKSTRGGPSITRPAPSSTARATPSLPGAHGPDTRISSPPPRTTWHLAPAKARVARGRASEPDSLPESSCTNDPVYSMQVDGSDLCPVTRSYVHRESTQPRGQESSSETKHSPANQKKKKKSLFLGHGGPVAISHRLGGTARGGHKLPHARA